MATNPTQPPYERVAAPVVPTLGDLNTTYANEKAFLNPENCQVASAAGQAIPSGSWQQLTVMTDVLNQIDGVWGGGSDPASAVIGWGGAG